MESTEARTELDIVDFWLDVRRTFIGSFEKNLSLPIGTKVVGLLSGSKLLVERPANGSVVEIRNFVVKVAPKNHLHYYPEQHAKCLSLIAKHGHYLERIGYIDSSDSVVVVYEEKQILDIRGQ